LHTKLGDPANPTVKLEVSAYLLKLGDSLGGNSKKVLSFKLSV
jgi:hypothetical protein